MTSFDSPESAFTTLSDPSSPDWLEAFAYLAQHPQTAQAMLDTFRETLEELGIEPSDVDTVTGEPSYSLRDVARAMGMPEAELDMAMEQAKNTEVDE